MSLAQSSALRALLPAPAAAKRAAADALETLALAWQAARTDEAGSGGQSSSGPSKSSKSRIGGHSSGGRADLGEAVRQSARMAVGAAQEVLNNHASKRRNGLAAERQRPLGGGSGSASLAQAGDADGPPSASVLLSSPPRAPFGVFARGSSECSGAGWAARQGVGVQRAAAMCGAVHLSRHCAYAPTFSDVAGLAVAVRRPPHVAIGAALNTQATFPRRVGEVPGAEKAWVLDRDSGGGGPSSGVGLKAEFGGNFGAQATAASAATRQRAKDGRRGPGEGKENCAAGEGHFGVGGLGLAGSRVAPPALRHGRK